MKLVLRLCLMACALTAAWGDTLRLRGGATLTGRYLGGNPNEVWFQRAGAPPEIVPTSMVEALEFDMLPGDPTAPLPGGAWKSPVSRFRPLTGARDACRVPEPTRYFARVFATD
jgi:hypothetical protein